MTPSTPPDDVTRSRNEDVDLVSQLVGHHLRQDDIRRILLQLSSEDREAFTERLARILRKTAALIEVSRRLADSLSLDVLLDRMVELVSDFLDAERCTIFLHDRETRELFTKAAVGLDRQIRFPDTTGIAGAVLASRRPVVIADAYADARFNPAVDKQTGFRTRNILCAPIIRRHEDGATDVVGVAQVLNKKAGEFTPDDLALLETLTAQAAGAFVNAQLHEQIARARSEESRLLEVTAALATELQLTPLLRKIMETVCMILEAERATLFLHDAKNRQLWARVEQDGQPVEIRFPDHVGIAGSVFTTGETVNIPDAYADPRFNRDVDFKTGFRTHSILCMPVVNRKGERIAVTQVLNRKGGPFGAIDEKRLRAFSSQAAVAMENAQLFEEVNRVKNYNEAILQSMTNAVVTLDAAGTIVKVNDAATRILRRPALEVMGHAAREFFSGANGWVSDAIDAASRTGEAQVTMDTDLHLPWVSPGADARPATASINLTAVPLGTLEQSLGSMVVIEDITNEKRLKTTMARYMPKEIAEKLLQEGEGALGGKSQKATVLFTDIRSFTTIAERIGPPETVRLLNEYFGLMVDVLMEHGGILDKYIGDAIMAVFGAPFTSPDDADHAVQTAVGMLRQLHGFNARRAVEGLDAVHMGVGINTDEVLSGNIGSLKRMDYTVIGDGVNLASRLESANKHYGTEILVSELTVRELRGAYRLREVDRMRVKGKNQPVAVFEVLDHLEGRVDGLDDVLAAYAGSLDAYRRGDWRDAQAGFEAVLRLRPDDGPSAMYAERCHHFLEHPPAPGWDGVWVMKDK